MNITKYASKSCVKCKALDRILSNINLPCKVNTLYAEDNEELFKEKNIVTLPTLEICENNEVTYLQGIVSPNQINEAINSFIKKV